MSYIIRIPEGDYQRDKFAVFCKRFGCRLLKKRRGDYEFRIETDNPINFFWLGCNLNFYYKTGLAISAASEIFNV